MCMKPKATESKPLFLLRLKVEARYLDIEQHIVRANETVRAFHVALRRFQNAEAVVLMHVARPKNGLLADHSFAFNLLIFAYRVVNQPAAREQLRAFLADIFNSHEIHKHIAVQWRLR